MRKTCLMQCYVGPHGFVYVWRPGSHFGGCTPRWAALTPKFELGRDFCAMHLPPKFRHPMLSRSEVIMLTKTSTNPQTTKNRFCWKHPTFFTMLRRWVIICVQTAHSTDNRPEWWHDSSLTMTCIDINQLHDLRHAQHNTDLWHVAELASYGRR